MKTLNTKLILMVVALLIMLTNVTAFSQDTLKVEYKSFESRELAEVANFLGMGYYKIIVTGDIKEKYYMILTHIVKDCKAVAEIDTFLSGWQLQNDTFTLIAKTINVDSNKVRIERHIQVIHGFSFEKIYDIGNNKDAEIKMTAVGSGFIYSDDYERSWFLTTNDTLPVIAYSPWPNSCFLGLKGLYADNFHPRLWCEMYGLQNYLYMEVKFLTVEEFKKITADE